MLGYDGMQWYDWVRVVQSILAVAAMYFLGRSFARRGRTDYTKRLRDFWWVLSVMLLIFCVGPIEQILRGREESWTLFMAVIVTFVALKASLDKERQLLKSDNGR